MRFTLANSPYGSIELNLTTGLLIKAGQEVNIRAKTLLVLKYLISQKEQVVTKQALLNEVWHDVVVQEQVLVQSIKEIRDLLGSKVIKTYPRQGYQWVAELSAITNKQTVFGQTVKRSALIPLAIMSFVIIISLVIYYLPSNGQSSKTANVTVALLPVLNDMPDDIHDWVPLQGMDYLSDSLNKNSQLQIIPRAQLLKSLPLSKQKNLPNALNDESLHLRTLAQTFKR